MMWRMQSYLQFKNWDPARSACHVRPRVSRDGLRLHNESYHSKCLNPWYRLTEELVGLYLSRYWASEPWTARFEFCLDCEITLARWGNLCVTVVVLLIVARVKRKKAKQEFVWTAVRIWISSHFRSSYLYISHNISRQKWPILTHTSTKLSLWPFQRSYYYINNLRLFKSYKRSKICAVSFYLNSVPSESVWSYTRLVADTNIFCSRHFSFFDPLIGLFWNSKDCGSFSF